MPGVRLFMTIIEAFKAWHWTFSAWRESFYDLYINCMFRILNNFSNIDNKFIIEAFKASQYVGHWQVLKASIINLLSMLLKLFKMLNIQF